MLNSFVMQFPLWNLEQLCKNDVDGAMLEQGAENLQRMTLGQHDNGRKVRGGVVLRITGDDDAKSDDGARNATQAMDED